jgi:starvation-inducible outer membrane lipoprotein
MIENQWEKDRFQFLTDFYLLPSLMKKITLGALLISMSILLIGCGKSAPQQIENSLPSNTGTMCAKTIQQYLDTADLK